MAFLLASAKYIHIGKKLKLGSGLEGFTSGVVPDVCPDGTFFFSCVNDSALIMLAGF